MATKKKTVDDYEYKDPRLETDNYFKKWRSSLNYVRSGEMSIEEFGALTALEIMVNPNQGYWLGNAALLAHELNISREKARYISDKLKAMGKIYFYLGQGRREKTKYYVIGLEIKHRIIMSADVVIRVEMGLNPNVPTLDFSEVQRQFPKSLWLQSRACPDVCKHNIVELSEVANKENDNKIDTENKKKTEIDKETSASAKKNDSPQSKKVSLSIFNELTASMGYFKAKEYLVKLGYEFPPEADHVS